ncbi:MAG: hypothetical protein HGA45_15775, partial [Chloroflexales bacterium]|nr:hypothetical protein [Chloroflexales bacterium]
VSGKVDQFDRDKAALARNFQYATCFIDSTGHCLFIAFAILDIASGFEGAVDECNGVMGTNWTMDDVGRIGKEVLDKELAFNRAAGLSKQHDRMPEFMKIEQLPPHNVTWDVPDETLDGKRTYVFESVTLGGRMRPCTTSIRTPAQAMTTATGATSAIRVRSRRPILPRAPRASTILS